MLGNLLMRLREQLRQGIMPGYELPMAEVRSQLLSQLRAISETVINEHFDMRNVYTLARGIDLSNISDIEKIDRLQMILDSAYFFRKAVRYQRATLSSEWIDLVNKKYPGEYSVDENFRYQLVKIGVLLAGPFVAVTDLRPLNISDGYKIEIYKLMARQSPVSFMSALTSDDHFGLDHAEIRDLYLYALQFDALSVHLIKDLPGSIVDDAFIQKVVNILNKEGFSLENIDLSKDNDRPHRVTVIRYLILAAASHGLSYRAVYTFDDKPVNVSNEKERRKKSDIYPSIEEDDIKLILQQH